MDFFHFNLDTLLFRLIAFVIAFSVHEWAHAMAAWRLGDPTAKEEGRLTLNPLAHVDPFGLLMILFGPFGWAKPVPFNALYFRGNRRLGIVLVAAAGPLSNLVLAFVFGWLVVHADRIPLVHAGPPWLAELVVNVFAYSLLINAALVVFNLLPIAPLDGAKIVRFLFPYKYDRYFEPLETYGPFLLLAIVFFPALRNVLLHPPLEGLLALIQLVVA